MQKAIDFFSNLFSTEDWPPRWHCGNWTEFHGWLYIVSDLAIWSAYFTIPFLLIHFILRKKNVPFPKIFWLFGTFILACGATHFIDALIFWFPVYRVSALVRFITAVASWSTIYALYKILPDAFSLKTPGELEKIVKDRTEELQLSMHKMRFLADAMPQIVWTARPDGSRDYFNLPTLKYSGKNQEELTEWKWVDLIHPDDREEYLKKWEESLNNGSDFEMEKRLRDATGNYRWHLSRAHPHRDGEANILMWVGTATDIELHKRTEELLEKQVRERTLELELVNKELARSNTDLEQFAGIASHDLQAPLRSINSFLEILESKNENLDEESRDYIHRSVSAAKRMKILIDSLLAYSRTNASKIDLNKTDLNEVMQDVLANISELLNTRHAKVECPVLPVINADRALITQVFQNLISNGIKYNESETPVITITFFESVKETNFKVSDNGVGIKEEYQKKVFDVFTRLQSDKEGTGLGLAICKRIIEKHGGTISLSSVPEQGTIFSFTIPKKA